MRNSLKSLILSSLILFNSNIVEAQELVKFEVEKACDYGYSINKDEGIITFSIKPREVYEITFLSESGKILTKINGKNEDKVCHFRDFRIGRTTKILFKGGKYYGVLEREYEVKVK